MRDKASNTAFLEGRAVMVIIMGLLYGSTIYQFDPTKVQVVMGMIFAAILFLSLGQASQIPTYVESREVFYKQRGADFLRTGASAKVIMDGARKGANTGRTIHQPSSEVFLLFDRLLLLKRGGETMFNGNLGPECANLIAYFEAVPGIQKIPAGYNPATWMLECIGAGVTTGSATGQETGFVGIFAQSEMKKTLTGEMAEEGVVTPAPSVAALAFGKCDTPGGSDVGCQTMRNAPVGLDSSMPIKASVKDVFDADRDDIPRNFGIMIAFIVLFRFSALLCLRYVNHQKR